MTGTGIKRADIIPEKIRLPGRLGGRMFLSYKEFGSLLGVSDRTVRHWVSSGYLKAAEFSPRYRMIPLSELERYKEGRLMEKRGGNPQYEIGRSRSFLENNGEKKISTGGENV